MTHSSSEAKIVSLVAGFEGSTDVFVRRAVVNLLGRFGTDAITASPALVRSLSDGDTVVACEAVRALDAISSHEEVVIPFAVELLKRNRKSGQARANLLIASEMVLRPKLCVSGLIVALSDEVVLVRRSAAQFLGWCGEDGKVSVPTLVDALNDSDAHVRGNAALALGWIGHDDTQTVTALRRALSDTDGVVRLNAHGALVKMKSVDDLLPHSFEKGDNTRPPLQAAKGRMMYWQNQLRWVLEETDHRVQLTWTTDDQSFWLELRANITGRSKKSLIDTKNLSISLIDQNGRMIGPKNPKDGVAVVTLGGTLTLIAVFQFEPMDGKGEPKLAHIRIRNELQVFPLRR